VCNSSPGSPPGSGGGGGCFIAGTQVLLGNGQWKAIEQISTQDQVLHYLENQDAVGSAAIARTLFHAITEQELFSFQLSNGRTLTSNDVHLIYVISLQRYVSAAEIYWMWFAGLPVQFLNSKGDSVEVLAIRKSVQRVAVYNLHVQTGIPSTAYYLMSEDVGHNYFAEDVLVHNAFMKN
jgi:hypothetical protein